MAGTGATEKVRHVVTENISQDECTITRTVNLHTFQAVRQFCVVPQQVTCGTACLTSRSAMSDSATFGAPTGPTPADSREVKSWIKVLMNRSHALGSSAAVATSGHTVIMCCLQGCRITLCLALRSVQTGVLIKTLWTPVPQGCRRIATLSASSSAQRLRRNSDDIPKSYHLTIQTLVLIETRLLIFCATALWAFGNTFQYTAVGIALRD